jgi:hypothetical protein
MIPADHPITRTRKRIIPQASPARLLAALGLQP